MVSWIW